MTSSFKILQKDLFKPSGIVSSAKKSDGERRAMKRRERGEGLIEERREGDERGEREREREDGGGGGGGGANPAGLHHALAS